MKKNSRHLFHRAENNYVETFGNILFERFRTIECEIIDRKINIALSGGTTPVPILRYLKQFPLHWERFNFFLVDERCVPENDAQSNYGNIKRAFFDDITSISYPMYNDDCASSSASTYESLIIEHVLSKDGLPSFDLILLGLGDDGHTASLFPRTEALYLSDSLVAVNPVPQLGTTRITLTYPTILNASKLIVMAIGQVKRTIIEDLYNEKENSKDYPMLEIITKHHDIEWLTD